MIDDARAFIGLGANLGRPREAIVASLASIARLPRTRLTAVSSLYRSAPVDAPGPDFLNAVAAVETGLDAQTLLARLQAIEREHGRVRSHRNAPRTLDLDLLMFADLELDTAALQLPHPRMHLRAFVLVPLAEIAPSLRIPARAPLAQLLRKCAQQAIEPLATAQQLLAEAQAAGSASTTLAGWA